MPFFGRKSSAHGHADEKESDRTLAHEPLSKDQIKRATRTRNTFGWFTSFCLFVSVVFLIICEIGGTSNKPVLRNIWFLRMDLSNIVPTSIPNSVLLNSIAQTLGLADFYQVGLWNYCQGDSDGVISCTKPQTLYYFDPVEIIRSQLIAGAVKLTQILDIIRIASHWMFGLFLAGACLSFVLMFLLPTTVRSRWISFLLTILTFVNALAIVAASVIATVMFVIMKTVFNENNTVNINASVGVTMFAMMWGASVFAIIAFIFQLGLCCCCASRRDVRTGRKTGSKKAYRKGVIEN